MTNNKDIKIIMILKIQSRDRFPILFSIVVMTITNNDIGSSFCFVLFSFRVVITDNNYSNSNDDKDITVIKYSIGSVVNKTLFFRSNLFNNAFLAVLYAILVCVHPGVIPTINIFALSLIISLCGA